MSSSATGARARGWRLPRMMLRLLLLIAALGIILYAARFLLGLFTDLNRVGVTGDAGADPAKARIEWRGEQKGPVVIFDGALAADVPEEPGANRFTVYYEGRRIGELGHLKTDANDDHTYIFHLHGPPDSVRCDLDIIRPDGGREPATSEPVAGH